MKVVLVLCYLAVAPSGLTFALRWSPRRISSSTCSSSTSSSSPSAMAVSSSSSGSSSVSASNSASSSTSSTSSTSSNSALPSVSPPPPVSMGLEKKTFRRFMQEEAFRVPDVEGLYPLLCSLELACRDINRLMRRVSTDSLDGLQGSSNIQGEDQKKLDVISNRIMKLTLCCSGKVSMVASEEDDEPCLCSTVTDSQAFSGEYAVVFDPLDGSSNIDSGLPTGTIFGVYRDPNFGPKDPTATVKQQGRSLVAAGYCLYSASCQLVITIRSGLHMFSLDDSTGQFYLTRSNIRMPRSGSIYSFNDVYADDWEPGVRAFLADLKRKKIAGLSAEQNAAKKPSGRYMGALVADVHNIILNGGIFGYPGTLAKPKGKLRLLYEANPLALVIEEAGGYASNGRKRILDLVVDDVHQRTPLFIGCVEEVSAIERYQSFFTFPAEA